MEFEFVGIFIYRFMYKPKRLYGQSYK